MEEELTSLVDKIKTLCEKNNFTLNISVDTGKTCMRIGTGTITSGLGMAVIDVVQKLSILLKIHPKESEIDVSEMPKELKALLIKAMEKELGEFKDNVKKNEA